MNVTQFVSWFLTEPLGKPTLKLLGFDSSSRIKFDEDGLVPRTGENLVPTNIAKVMARLVRFMLTGDPKYCARPNDDKRFLKILSKSRVHKALLRELQKKELTDKLIINTSLVLQYNIFFKAGFKTDFLSCRVTPPNKVTVMNIRKMVIRSVNFLKTFENLKSCYTNYSKRAFAPCQLLDRGVGDFRTNKCLIEMRAQSSRYISSKHIYECILQTLLNKNMGIKIEKIYIFMPRTGIYFVCETNKIPQYIISTIKNLW